MTLIKHELRQGKAAFLIWTAAIGFLLAVCVFLFPEMKTKALLSNNNSTNSSG